MNPDAANVLDAKDSNSKPAANLWLCILILWLSAPASIGDSVETALLVTGAGAVAILANRFVAATCGLVLAGPVVSCVATGTIGLVRRVLPCNGLRIALVAFRTQQITAMVLGLERKCCVTIVRRRPGIRAVTHIALFRGAEVIRVLTNSLHAIVAGRT